jgi:hypothetical protein
MEVENELTHCRPPWLTVKKSAPARNSRGGVLWCRQLCWFRSCIGHMYAPYSRVQVAIATTKAPDTVTVIVS